MSVTRRSARLLNRRESESTDDEPVNEAVVVKMKARNRKRLSDIVEVASTSKEIDDYFDNMLEHPSNFLNKSNQAGDRAMKESLKANYDAVRSLEHLTVNSRALVSSALPELLVDGFDHEQIWQQLELHFNERRRIISSIVKKFSSELSNFESDSDDIIIFDAAPAIFLQEIEEENEEDKGQDEEGESGPSDLEEDDNENEEFLSVENSDAEAEDKERNELFNLDAPDEHNKSILKRSHRKTEVDDNFFQLDAMEQFLELGDQDKLTDALGLDPDDRFDDVDDPAESEETEQAMYGQFFDPPPGSEENLEKSGDARHKSVHFDDLDGENVQEEVSRDGDDADSDTNSADPPTASTFESRQRNLKEQIAKLESENVTEKGWQLLGETTGESRPENSLLEEFVEFEHATRLAPVITEATTKTLEEIVIQRIKDKAWDDVERKVKPKNDHYEFKTDLVLDQEKSKLSLGEVYEQEYLKQLQKDEGEKTNPIHDEVRSKMKLLFEKLDALSNYHYAPPLPKAEIKIVNNMPSIAMEEVAPLTVTDATMLAPEEVKAKKNRAAEIKAGVEREPTDKKRERRQKKSLQRVKSHRIDEKNRKAVKAAGGDGAEEGVGKKTGGRKKITLSKDRLKTLQKIGQVKLPDFDQNVSGSKRKMASNQFFEKLEQSVKMLVRDGSNKMSGAQTSLDSIAPKKKKKKTAGKGGSFKL